ncbi:hypothetical protein [Ohtaekwangia koreensis]|uniref:Uncharacterized protein n=1 Tax=Ohtaekwangia koreensis TaxID=688867 RepID=A0A1T5LCJ9_9BACT|nr:hypothetical protein [Ohtaekwangia koreensis]SKC73614.1 hypothetical protein SAMN05660236_2955 [Ohtaekwangia koreensis]
MKKQFFTYSSIILAILLIFHIVKFTQRSSEYALNGAGDFLYGLLKTLTWAFPIYLVLAVIGGYVVALIRKNRGQRLGEK